MRILLNQTGRRGLTSFATFVILWFTILQNAMAYWSGDRIEQAIIQESLKSKFVSPSLALAVAETESSFRPHVVSHAGAVGVMQIMPATAYGMYKVKQEALFDPQTNIRIGVQYLEHLIKKYNGRIDLALSHYNGGSGVMKDGKARVLPHTLDYVARILARSKYYKVVLASGSQLTSRQQLAVQASNNHAKPKKRMDVSPHINHVDSWLTFIEELTPIRR
jgi:soluble lytic murein transglycosylase-like protein